jgi:hypothetical protein
MASVPASLLQRGDRSLEIEPTLNGCRQAAASAGSSGVE